MTNICLIVCELCKCCNNNLSLSFSYSLQPKVTKAKSCIAPQNERKSPDVWCVFPVNGRFSVPQERTLSSVKSVVRGSPKYPNPQFSSNCGHGECTSVLRCVVQRVDVNKALRFACCARHRRWSRRNYAPHVTPRVASVAAGGAARVSNLKIIM